MREIRNIRGHVLVPPNVLDEYPLEKRKFSNPGLSSLDKSQEGLSRMIRLKVLALVSTVIALQGCETVGNIVPSIPEVIARNKFEGRNIQQAYAELGKPSEIVKAGDGQSMAVWIHVMGHQVTSSSNVVGAGPGPNGVAVTSTSSTRTLTRRCDIQITFDQNMIITRYNAWNREPLACTQYYNGG